MQRSYISVQRNPLLEPKYEFQGTPLISTGICLKQDSLSFQGRELIRLLGTFARGKWRGKAKDSSLLHTWVSQDTSTCQWLKFNHAKHQQEIHALEMFLGQNGQGNLSDQNSLQRFWEGSCWNSGNLDFRIFFTAQQLLCCNN